MKRSMIGILLIVCLGFFWSCGARWERTPLVDNPDIHVSLERRVEGAGASARQFNHPFSADPDRLARFLGELQYKEPPRFYGEAQKRPVFQSMEIMRLAAAVTEALEKATPEQRVRFVSYNRGGGLIFKKMRRTGGIFFIDAQRRLNLAFGYINHEIMDEEFRGVQKEKVFPDPLILDTAKKTARVSSEAVSHRTRNGDKMPLWLVADAALISPGGRPEDKSGAAEAEKPAASRPQEPPAKSAGDVRRESAAADEPAGDAWERQKEAVKKKLAYFKELHDAGLITTEEYNARKKELLDQIH